MNIDYFIIDVAKRNSFIPGTTEKYETILIDFKGLVLSEARQICNSPIRKINLRIQK